ncbi:MAG: transposase [Deltaproteobacteria bacterium]|nr:transposase [Deltaproteobacteria bacterium]
MELGMPERRTHNHVRHGTLDLLAAVNAAPGEVAATTKKQHRGKDFVAFLTDIDGLVEPALDVHVILDSLSAHKPRT